MAEYPRTLSMYAIVISYLLYGQTGCFRQRRRLDL